MLSFESIVTDCHLNSANRFFNSFKRDWSGSFVFGRGFVLGKNNCCPLLAGNRDAFGETTKVSVISLSNSLKYN
jgi:hypothetical protein